MTRPRCADCGYPLDVGEDTYCAVCAGRMADEAAEYAAEWRRRDADVEAVWPPTPEGEAAAAAFRARMREPVPEEPPF